ncbi:hypothetical protein IQ454_004763 [Salmonella enterica]|nr:hypothetical protein [Salmonella enterica subsp. enterica]EGC4745130.1 hypothetical protein [Salmonella enterica]EGL4350693.1 hypothetical protein [Salmonella enterica]EGL4359932.1 hypothetical protein [Salmonella enterica]EGL4382961.1 hypothetical protein [Salmonella enterica]
MIEEALRDSLISLTGLPVFPLLLPEEEPEGVTYQRISDPLMDTGLVTTTLVQARFQVTLYLLSDFSRINRLDKKIRDAWTSVVHGDIAGFPVQAVQRGGVRQGAETLTSGAVQYRLARDFIITYAEADERDNDNA